MSPSQSQAQEGRGHTPGPWEARIVGNDIRVIRSDAEGFQTVCKTGCAGMHAAMEDARLIAAAPVMKSALYDLAMLALQSERYGHDPEYRDAVDNALMAYRRATGEG